MSSYKYTLMFDGGSSGNPGPSGCGSVLYENETEIWSDAFYVGDRETNNTAEYMGLIRGLKHVVEIGNVDNLTVKGDSLLVIKQMKGEYKVNTPHIKVLNSVAKELAKKIKDIEFIHIPREMNKRADELSRVR